MTFIRRVLGCILAALLIFGFVAAAEAQEECDDSVFAEVVYDSVIVYHNGAWYNCCAIIQFSLNQQDTILDLYEVETFDPLPCLCMCCFDLSATIVGLDPGLYRIRVWNESNLLGQTRVVVGEPSLGGFAQSDCYEVLVTDGQEEKGEEECEDSVFAGAMGGEVIVHHAGAWYNCCSTIEFDLMVEGNTVHLREIETGLPCWCMCCFDLTATIVGLNPGTYLIEVWDEYMTVLYGEAWVTVGGSDKGGTLGPVTQGDCYNVSAPDEQATASDLPREFALSQNHPNPFNPQTEIRYALPVDSWTKLEVFNLLGQRVATLVDEPQKAGFQRIIWKAQGVAGGIYFCRLQAGDHVATKRMILLK